jgi:hypothetical protein
MTKYFIFITALLLNGCTSSSISYIPYNNSSKKVCSLNLLFVLTSHHPFASDYDVHFNFKKSNKEIDFIISLWTFGFSADSLKREGSIDFISTKNGKEDKISLKLSNTLVKHAPKEITPFLAGNGYQSTTVTKISLTDLNTIVDSDKCLVILETTNGYIKDYLPRKIIESIKKFILAPDYMD